MSQFMLKQPNQDKVSMKSRTLLVLKRSRFHFIHVICRETEIRAQVQPGEEFIAMMQASPGHFRSLHFFVSG